MKLGKIVAAVLLAVLLVGALPMGTVVYAEEAESADVGRLAVGEGASKLDNKKILFAGNSFTYYGGMIERSGAYLFDQEKRTESETGFFARLAAINGVKNLTVTDWTYGGHDLTDIFDGCCDRDDKECYKHDHAADLVDRNYDIVILQDTNKPHYTSGEDHVDSIRLAMDIFRAENPDTEFYLLIHSSVYKSAVTHIPESAQLAIEELGVKVIDWGALIYDIINGYAKVPDSVFEYHANTFIVSNSAADGYHPNVLTGYLCSAMVYAALTGETVVDQPYEFIYDLNSKYLNIDKFKSTYYKYDDPTTEFNESETNMKEIFYSPSEMRGLQILANEYLSKTKWLDVAEYTVEFKAGDEVVSSGEYKWGESVKAPDAPEKPSEEHFDYVFLGWDKTVTECRGYETYTALYERVPSDFVGTVLSVVDSIASFFIGIFDWFIGIFGVGN